MADMELDGVISKTDDEHRIVFGWAYVAKSADGEEQVDHSGDGLASMDNLEERAYDFVLKSRVGGDTHAKVGVATMVESIVFTKEKQKALGIPEGVLPEGWWVGFKVHDDETWSEFKKGRRSSFSIHGSGTRKQIKMEESA